MAPAYVDRHGVTDGSSPRLRAAWCRAAASSVDDLTLLAEIGQHWLSTSAYSEVQSAANPFQGPSQQPRMRPRRWKWRPTGHIASTTPPISRFAPPWERPSPAPATLSPRPQGPAPRRWQPVGGLYAEAGLRLGWMVSDSTRLDLYASGTTGDRIGTAGHIGGGLSVGFLAGRD